MAGHILFDYELIIVAVDYWLQIKLMWLLESFVSFCLFCMQLFVLLVTVVMGMIL